MGNVDGSGPTPFAAAKPRRKPARVRRTMSRGRALNYTLAAVVMVAYVFPLLFLLNTALKSNADFYANPMGIVNDPQFGNFPEAWQQGNFGAYFLNSIAYTSSAALLGTAISILIGFPVARGYLRHPKLWSIFLVVMLFLPNAIITQFQLLLRINLYDTALGYILIMAAGVGIGPLIIRAHSMSLPKELDEAATLDGVGYFRFLVTFVIPLSRPAIATVFILQAIGVWNELILATILLPDAAKAPLTLGLYAFQGTFTSQWGLLAAATLIVAAPLLVGYVFLQKYLMGGALGGALKG